MDYSLESDFVKQLDRDIMEFVLRGMENTNEERFSELALREFELQYHTVEPYRKFCNKKGITPETAERWEQIPAVPSLAFKNFVIASFPIEKAEHSYFTSGT
ncbi:MAG: acyl-protein synthetase, partial [Nitrospirota bacterium]|nr:acyl-protein synthetase [Nitrospirota bacterium]